jgi:hypothetical protein
MRAVFASNPSGRRLGAHCHLLETVAGCIRNPHGTTMNEHTPLSTLRQNFLDTSTTSMPISGLNPWSIAAFAG